MPLHVGYYLAVPVFLIGITRESRVKPPSQDLPWPVISPCLVLWRGTCPCLSMERHLPLLALTRVR
jgi:hypothetical protein